MTKSGSEIFHRPLRDSEMEMSTIVKPPTTIIPTTCLLGNEMQFELDSMFHDSGMVQEVSFSTEGSLAASIDHQQNIT